MTNTLESSLVRLICLLKIHMHRSPLDESKYGSLAIALSSIRFSVNNEVLMIILDLIKHGDADIILL